MFAAHQRLPRPGRHLFDSRDAFGEQRAGRHLFAIGGAAMPGASAEFQAEDRVTDAGGVESTASLGRLKCDSLDAGFDLTSRRRGSGRDRAAVEMPSRRETNARL